MSDNPLFDASYRRLFGEGVGIDETAEPFFASFYEIFLSDPEIAAFFSESNMPRQISMLRKSFFQLTAFYVSYRPSPELERLAKIHAGLGIGLQYYDRWLDALIETVRRHDPESDEPTELAWRWAMTPGLTYMRLFGQPSDEEPENPP